MSGAFAKIRSKVRGTCVKTAVLCFADGTVFYGEGAGAEGEAVGEVCFNTALTGYQEILTDPSYASQIVNFTFPHIGNVGVNPEDCEFSERGAVGFITRAFVSEPSSWRATNNLRRWAQNSGLIGICGPDTRAITAKLRDQGAQNAVIAHRADGNFDIPSLIAKAKAWGGLSSENLTDQVTRKAPTDWTEKRWAPETGYLNTENTPKKYHTIVIDYGVKNNIMRSLADLGHAVTVVPAKTSFAEISALKPTGIVLSNGPGDPLTVAPYAVPVIQEIIAADLPVFGICFGHQLLALAIGAKTEKMKFGHHGANHPVKNLLTQKVEIVSMNHGFTVVRESLPQTAEETHISLFDGSNCGIHLKDRPVFSVQYHPEASPGPNDSFYLFKEFTKNMDKQSVSA
jgi:carbamoyl-phosphate synthase small subunit